MNADFRRFLPGNKNLFRDLAVVLAGFLLALAVGAFVNLFRSDPVSFPYRAREARLLASVPGVVKEPRVVGLHEAEESWRQRSAVFIDARESDFFEEGHIPGAINIPVSQLAHPTGLPENKSAALIVYCSGGDCEDSRILAKALGAAGYGSISVLAGGWDEWTAAGLPQ
jgi:rhodanese-related sulfurtransferase